jgi:hypothetical protein
MPRELALERNAQPPIAKQPTKPRTHSWSIYRLRGTPAQLIGIVYDQPDEASAIAKAIEDFRIPENQRKRLIARRLD